MERAKELFYQYRGNRFYMDHDGVEQEYDSFHISRETEERWAEEYVSRFLKAGLRGKEARRAYAAAAELLRYDSCRPYRAACLYYPLRAEQLDDVTVLFMLSDSFRMAEKAAKAHRLSEAELNAYLPELDRFIRAVRERSENGTLTRSEDYVLQEFSDPAYTAEFLSELKKKWNGLK